MNICYQFVFVIIGSVVYSTYQKECIPLITDFSQQVCINKAYENTTYYYSMKESTCIPKCDKYKEAGHNRDKCPCPPAYSCEKRCKGTTAHSKIPCETDNDCPRGSRGCVSMCIADRDTCMAYHAKTTDFLTNMYTAQKFKPACENNGDWAAKQCKGGVSGRCFCFDKKGKRLFGEAAYSESTNMTCACSRKKADLMATGSFYVSMHCDSMGNFEPLQCDSGLCWCVEPNTGELISAVVPEKAMSRLHCYSIAEIGSQYLRKCDSIKYAIEKITHTLKLHGVQYNNMGNVVCDGDGAYGKYNVSKGIAYCTWRDGTTLPFQSDTDTDMSKLTCNCARDLRMYSHKLKCTGAGDYDPLQSFAVSETTYHYCVDVDGFAKTDLVTERLTCSKYY